jgi:hypothetical protein
MKRRLPRNSDADMFIPDCLVVHDDSRIAGRVRAGKFCNCPMKSRNNSVLGGVS